MFNVGDEFITHAFKAHLIGRICTLLKLKSLDDDIQHDISVKWLRDTAEMMVPKTFFPESSEDPVLKILCTTFTGPFCTWPFCTLGKWPAHPKAVDPPLRWHRHEMKNIANVRAEFAAYIVSNNRTVNMQGKPGKGEPLDQLIEHYNL